MGISTALNSFNHIYESSSEKELIKMWSDITEKNIISINRNLMKVIAESEDKLKDVKDIIYSKQMWDSEKSAWVAFDIWGAHFIVNNRKEYLVLRIYRPCKNQPEFGPTIKGWHYLDSSHLNETLKKKEYQNFYKILRDDRQGYEDEGRINDYQYKKGI